MFFVLWIKLLAVSSGVVRRGQYLGVEILSTPRRGRAYNPVATPALLALPAAAAQAADVRGNASKVENGNCVATQRSTGMH